jgi:hypothetical protein
MRRATRMVLTVVVVLGGLVVAADRLAVAYTESQAAQKIKSAKGLTSEPSVSVKGFPFLTQLLARDLDEVTVSVENVTTSADGALTGGAQPLRVARFTADLHSVRINGDLSGAVADAATGTALIPYAEVTKLVAAQLSGTVSDAAVGYAGTNGSGQGQVRVSGSVRIPFLGSQQLSGVAPVEIRNGDSVALSLPSEAAGLIGGESAMSWPLSGLPSGITLSGVQAKPQGLEVSLNGNHVQLTG